MLGIRSVLDEREDVELFINDMDTKRRSGPAYLKQLRDLYANKYQFIRFDAIISSDDNALDFLLLYRDELFPNVPVIFSGINDYSPNRIEGHKGYTGVFETYDVSGTIGIMLQLHPQTQSITIITDSTYSGNAFKGLVEKAEPQFVNDLQFNYLFNKDPEVLKRAMSELPDTALVLWGVYLRTPSGASISSEASIKMISDSSKVPIYSIWDVVGQGVVGGKITKPNYQGETSAKLALRVLMGELASDIPVTGSPLTNVFDYERLQHFSINETSLPDNSVLLNKPFSFYEEYELLIWLVSSFMLILLITITALIYYIQQKKIVVKALLLSQKDLAQRRRMDAIDQLAGGIAHDFNNILGVILGYVDLLKRHLTEQPKLEKFVNHIDNAGHRGVKLTKKLLSLSRKKSLDASKVDINKVLKEQQDLLQKMLTVRIELVIYPEPNVWLIWGDSNEFEDVILNLSINAMHAMVDKTSGAQLTIQTNNKSLNARNAKILGLPVGDYVQVSIKDNGCGMDETVKERLFEPFFSTKGEKGTGLGLSMVFGFIKSAGGSIEVSSALGFGSQFLLYLPRYVEQNTEKKLANINDVTGFGGNEKILVVDDEVALRDLLFEYLTFHGYQVYIAKNSKKALEILENEPIDLLLSDIIMPETNGYQLAAIAQKKYPTIKIQLVSGYTDERFMEMIDKKLNENRLQKPYNLQILVKSIRKLLDST
jgi:signal transduction histidine kinase/CheY-like chemotaxis protein